VRYGVKLSGEEVAALATLVGTPLDQVAVDGWAAELRTETSVVYVVPEEVPTPDAEHPHGSVERPRVQVDGKAALADSYSVLRERLGLVRAVNVVSILVGFTPMIECPPDELRPGGALPASQGYGWRYFPIGQREQAEREVGAGALVDLDVAFEIVCDGCPSLVVYTRGFFVQVSPQGLPADEDWVAPGAYTRRPVSEGGRAESSAIEPRGSPE
jgi:hypothetical protein